MPTDGLWRRIPVVVRAVVAGSAIGLAGTVPWASLVAANLKHWTDFPWSVPIMAAILFAWWQYFARGRGWPAATASVRRSRARANRVPDALWGPAIGTGLLGLVGVLLLQGVVARLVSLPQQRDIDPSQFPAATVFAWVVMSALVAGIVEETAFRGYIQGTIERRHGPVIAILVTGVLFGVGHFTHPEVGLVLLPYYMAVAAVYGGLAYATDSTYPSMLLHAGGNIFSAFSLFVGGRSEWQPGADRPVPVWQSGVDLAFIANLLALLVVGAATVWAYRSLVAAARAGK